MVRRVAVAIALVSIRCGGERGAAATASSSSGVDASTTGSEGTGTTTTSSSSATASSNGTSTGMPPLFDLGRPDLDPVDTVGPPTCEVGDDADAIGNCRHQAPAGAFEPELQWSWDGANGDVLAIATPLVANLTDDDGNGSIDLCDVPDVLVIACNNLSLGMGHLYVLDGATGSEHFHIDTPLECTLTPALGDIDGDGLPEIVAGQMNGHLVAFDHDGTMLWQSPQTWPDWYFAALALADLDADGDVEILAGGHVFGADGMLQVTTTQAPQYSATTAADLDDDGELEIVLGHAAYHHDGSEAWTTALSPGFPQVANLDDDPEPEVLLTNPQGLSLIDHDGNVRYQELRPTGNANGFLTWLRPATVHDFDGDGVAEFAMSSQNDYTLYEADATIVWSSYVSDESGVAAGTAFDFLGDGLAEAMYADESSLYVFDELGAKRFETPRTSVTGTEYPVVADVDNDGAAEIVVVSNQSPYGPRTSPTVQVVRDVDERWVGARRIWNQHTYHVTNVREDGTIPQVEPKSWQQLNTFRTNAQLEAGSVCQPLPRG